MLLGAVLRGLGDRPASSGTSVMEVSLYEQASALARSRGNRGAGKTAPKPGAPQPEPAVSVNKPQPGPKRISPSSRVTEAATRPARSGFAPSSSTHAAPARDTLSGKNELGALRRAVVPAASADGELGAFAGERSAAGPAGEADLRPRCVSCPRPEYSLNARRRGWQGVVEVAVEVAQDGAVASASVRRSSGRRTLDLAAVRAARKSRFTPALRKGVPTALRGRVRYRFQLVAE